MIQFSQTELDARWDILNHEIREAILSEKVDRLINDVLTKHDLVGFSENIITLCIYAIHGLLDQNLFLSELTALIGATSSPFVAKDLISEVIIPILSLKPTGQTEEAPAPSPVATIPLQAPTVISTPAPTVVSTLPIAPTPTPATAPAPFVIHAETETIIPVKETKKSLAEPVRPKFYEEEGSSESAAPPSYAKLQFATPATPPENPEMKPEFQEKEPTENNITLKDLPL